jgi:UDP-N-acetylglucosamine--N-acetylmuramyl-(pentapeptide) pyrophosphoryl-undecaprenol N-acetylglucosamine transferase
MRVVIAGGGTGGHLFPGLAVARTLQRLRPDAEIHWLGGQRGIERDILPLEGYPLTLLTAPSLRVSAAGHLANLRDAVALARSIPQAIRYLRRLRPDVIFSTGGYIAIPTLLAAAVTRTPSLIWEGNVQAGRSNRLVAPLASARAVAWPSTAAHAPWSRPNTYVTGTPVRSFAGHDRTVARRRLGIASDAPLLLVFGGSQRVLRFERALAGSLEAILSRWQVIHVAADGIEQAEAIRASLPEALQSRYTPVRFLQGGAMEDALISADLLLGRAGASTLAEASALGIPSIIVPYPYAGGHQHANARELAAVGGAVVIEDASLTPEVLQREVAKMSAAPNRRQIGSAATSLDRPGAAEEIARILLRLGSRG